MPIDIDELTEAELADLNRRIVERLRFLSQARAHSAMLDFSIGEQVSFQPEGRLPLTGIISKYNRKSVTVITSDGQQWNVSPAFLRKSKQSGKSDAVPAPVIALPKK